MSGSAGGVRFEVVWSQDSSRPYQWRIVAAADGEVLAVSAPCADKAQVLAAIDAVRGGAAGASVSDRAQSSSGAGDGTP